MTYQNFITEWLRNPDPARPEDWLRVMMEAAGYVDSLQVKIERLKTEIERLKTEIKQLKAKL